MCKENENTAKFIWLILVGVVCVGCGEEDVYEETPLPCDVAEVFAAKCAQCHNPELNSGAPMDLSAWQVTQEPSVFVEDSLIWEEIQKRTHDEARPMPPVGQPSINFDEHDVLDRWFRAGAPAGTTPCAV